MLDVLGVRLACDLRAPPRIWTFLGALRVGCASCYDSAVASFNERVWALVRSIPRGRVATYGQIAGLLDRPLAARAVGGAMRECPTGVPWHRVVNATGKIS